MTTVHEPTRLIHEVVGPTILSFTFWVLRTAAEQNIQRLYFVSRDAQLPYKIAKRIAASESGPECRYLYGSRQAWFLPSLDIANPYDSVWPPAPTTITAAGLLTKLQLNVPELQPHLITVVKDLTRPLSPSEALALYRGLIASSPFREHLEQRIQHTRAIVSRYFHQEGLTQNIRWALVDVGWFLRGQAAIRRILAPDRPEVTTHGLYFGLGPAAKCFPLPSQDSAFAFISPRASKLPIQKYHLLIEHVFTSATHPTVTGYTTAGQRVEPTFSTEPVNPLWQAYTSQLHAAALATAHRLCDNGAKTPIDRRYELKALHSLRRFVRHPRASEVRSIADIPATRIHAARAQESLWAPLASPLTLRSILQGLADVGSLRKGPPHIVPWLEGSAAISRWLIRAPIRPLIAILRRKQTLELRGR